MINMCNTLMHARITLHQQSYYNPIFHEKLYPYSWWPIKIIYPIFFSPNLLVHELTGNTRTTQILSTLHSFLNQWNKSKSLISPTITIFLNKPQITPWWEHSQFPITLQASIPNTKTLWPLPSKTQHNSRLYLKYNKDVDPQQALLTSKMISQCSKAAQRTSQTRLPQANQ